MRELIMKMCHLTFMKFLSNNDFKALTLAFNVSMLFHKKFFV